MSQIMSPLFPMTGGIVLPDHKSLSTQSPIRFAGIPEELVLPLIDTRHYRLTASIGQTVLKGDPLAIPKTNDVAVIHAPTSGIIHAIEKRPISHPSGLTADCIVLQTDGKDTWTPHQGITDFEALSATELIARIEAAGIIGLGGAGFSSAQKLMAGLEHSIENLIINAAESEPYITADDRLIQERATDILQGIHILQHIIQPTHKTIIAIEDNKPAAIAQLKQTLQSSTIDIAIIPTLYPSGGEKQLIQILTGQEVPSDSLPIEIGSLCINVATVYAISRAIIHGEPLLSRITTLSGDRCTNPQNVEVLLGTPIHFLISPVDKQNTNTYQLIVGGPMMGYSVPSADIPITKTTHGVLLQPRFDELVTPSHACIRCSHCADVCPASLQPQELYLHARKQDTQQLNTYHLSDCIECGACAYVCPSNIPLVHYFRAAKSDIAAQQDAQSQSDHYKTRFEARLQRIERWEKEKAAAKLARQEAAQKLQAEKTHTATEATVKNSKLDVIQAAIERAKAKKLAQQREADSTNQQPQDSQQ